MAPSKKKYPCLSCEAEVGGKAGAVQCGYCDRWVHPKCGDISKTLMDILIEQKDVVSWYCTPCTAVSKKVKKELQNINLKQEEMRVQVEANKDQLSVHKSRLDDHEKKIEALDRNKLIQDSNETMMKELQEQNARKNNLVIHQIPEQPVSLTRGGDKRDHDINKVLEIFEFLDCRINKDGIKFIYRPGERSNSERPRPVILNLRDPGARNYILANSRLLANSKFEKISIIPDLTPNQRKCEENLRKDAERLNREMEAEESLNWEWLLVGERGQRRLIKRKKLYQQKIVGQSEGAHCLTGGNRQAPREGRHQVTRQTPLEHLGRQGGPYQGHQGETDQGRQRVEDQDRQVGVDQGRLGEKEQGRQGQPAGGYQTLRTSSMSDSEEMEESTEDGMTFQHAMSQEEGLEEGEGGEKEKRNNKRKECSISPQQQNKKKTI